jgi:hypothetical protein
VEALSTALGEKSRFDPEPSMNHFQGQKEHHPSAWDHVGNEDVERMHLSFRGGYRKDRCIPLWALDDAKVRLVVYNYTSNYARTQLGVNCRPGMSLRELEAACLSVRKAKEAMLKANPGLSKHANYEEHVRTTQNGIAPRAVTIIYKAYRERLSSKDIAETMDMSWCAVRQILYRLNNLARRLFPADQQLPPHWSTKGLKIETRASQRIRRLTDAEITPHLRSIVDRYNAGVPVKEIAKQEGMSRPAITYRLYRAGSRRTRQPRQPGPHFTLSDEVIQRWMSGEHSHKLAAELGIKTGALRARMRRLGHVRRVLRGGNNRKPGFSEAQARELGRRWRGGESAKELAAELGIPSSTFIARLRTFGIRRGPINGKRC